jgi:hypothetical protein
MIRIALASKNHRSLHERVPYTLEARSARALRASSGLAGPGPPPHFPASRVGEIATARPTPSTYGLRNGRPPRDPWATLSPSRSRRGPCSFPAEERPRSAPGGIIDDSGRSLLDGRPIIAECCGDLDPGSVGPGLVCRPHERPPTSHTFPVPLSSAPRSIIPRLRCLRYCGQLEALREE